VACLGEQVVFLCKTASRQHGGGLPTVRVCMLCEGTRVAGLVWSAVHPIVSCRVADSEFSDHVVCTRASNNVSRRGRHISVSSDRQQV
jgi:hypothetical protein